jgi:hypothetical protein
VPDAIVPPPLQQPPIDPATSRFTRPWAIWFQEWARLLGAYVAAGGGTGGTGGTGGVTPPVVLADQPASTLLGRGSASAGPPEVITLGVGLAMTGTVLSAPPRYYEPLTNGIVATPELVFVLGDCIMVEVF